MEHLNEPPVCADIHSDAAHEAYILSNVPNEDAAIDASELFTQLSSPARIRLLSMLVMEDLCVGELADILGMSQPAVSHHLRLLRQSGVVKYRKSGKHVIYCISDTVAGRLARHVIRDVIEAVKGEGKEE